MFKVLARPLHSKNAYKTFKEFDTLDEAMATAARLERNAGTAVEIIVELPDNSLQKTPLRLLELTA
jgi:hypothetical protein